MNSERFLAHLRLAVGLAAAACADLERGQPLADASPAPADAVLGGGGATGDAGATRSFARDVHPLLLAACADCHSETGQASRSSFLLVRDPAKDRAQVGPFINPDSPTDSRLLSKGSGVGHQGGAALPAGTPEYQTILAWITQGSLP